MAKLYFIHNEQSKESRDALAALQAEPDLAAILEAEDFMTAREKHWFRASPTLWILPTGAEVKKENVSTELEGVISAQQVREKIAAGRVLTLNASKTTITLSESLQITTAATDLDGNPTTISLVKFSIMNMHFEDPDGVLDFSASAPGMYAIETINADCVPGYLEVTVIDG